MVINTTFNNISVISWWSVILVEETRVPGGNHRPVASHWQIYHIMLYRVHLAWAGFELTTLVVIGTDYIVGVDPTTIPSWPQWPLHFVDISVWPVIISDNNGFYVLSIKDNIDELNVHDQIITRCAEWIGTLSKLISSLADAQQFIPQ